MNPDHYTCPGCNRYVPISPTGCPHCRPPKPKPRKKTTKHSWQQDPGHDGLDLPDEDFDYDDFVAREFGRKPHRQTGVKWYWWCLGVAILVLWILRYALGMLSN